MSDTPRDPLTLLQVDFDPFAAPQGELLEQLELTEQQREVYAATLMGDEASCSYNQCFALRLRGPLSEQSLRNALAQVVQRHAALRLRIDSDAESSRSFLPSMCGCHSPI